jgi:hypothetical protein
MKKKMRKFSEGGFETAVGQSRIDEDTRARGMRSVMPDDSPAGTSTYGEENASPVTVTKTKTSVTAPATPKVDMDAEKARTEKMLKDQALIKIHPEDFLPGPGMLKGMLKQVVGMGAKRTAKEAAEGAAKNATRRAEEGFNPSEALDALKPTRNVSVKGKDIPVKQGKPNFGNSTEGKGVKEVATKSGKKIPVKRSMDDMIDDGGAGAFKRGGKVSSASRRADGCAIRGKTRA